MQSTNDNLSNCFIIKGDFVKITKKKKKIKKHDEEEEKIKERLQKLGYV